MAKVKIIFLNGSSELSRSSVVHCVIFSFLVFIFILRGKKGEEKDAPTPVYQQVPGTLSVGSPSVPGVPKAVISQHHSTRELYGVGKGVEIEF